MSKHKNKYPSFTQLLNPLSSTIEHSWNSHATILASSSSNVFCLTGVVDLCTNCVIELWVGGLAGCGGGVLDDAVDSDAAATVAVDKLALSFAFSLALSL